MQINFNFFKFEANKHGAARVELRLYWHFMQGIPNSCKNAFHNHNIFMMPFHNYVRDVLIIHNVITNFNLVRFIDLVLFRY